MELALTREGTFSKGVNRDFLAAGIRAQEHIAMNETVFSSVVDLPNGMNLLVQTVLHCQDHDAVSTAACGLLIELVNNSDHDANLVMETIPEHIYS